MSRIALDIPSIVQSSICHDATWKYHASSQVLGLFPQDRESRRTLFTMVTQMPYRLLQYLDAEKLHLDSCVQTI